MLLVFIVHSLSGWKCPVVWYPRWLSEGGKAGEQREMREGLLGVCIKK